MIFGAGLVAGLLGQIGEALNSDRLETIAEWSSWALPFEALYQDALYRITSDPASPALRSSSAPSAARTPAAPLPLWTLAYFAVVLGASIAAFARKTSSSGVGS